ncbi:HAMP domain-containing histidine kinase [Motiliproteus sp. MSK22-1]|uniref:HAMP domain-containing histidine kinase n=1 Tax=Motiliproteus sp. MSK22-1 TaxID=1897630 RepID=UPI00097637A1|nr:HAMP domain-containing histidine kinase [Motiliproteus sp. MSK22-1]OMH25780.1 hypothetical protein BGP75_24975 [Motiliproteus sp. MSK22-1]
MRSRIFLKFLLTLLATLSAIVLLMLFIVNWSFQQGFADYLQQGEIRKASVVSALLADEFLQIGHWRYLQGNFQHWRRVLEQADISLPPAGQRRRPPPPPRLGGKDNRIPPPAPPPPEDRPGRQLEPNSLAHRLGLYDANRNLVIGQRNPTIIEHWLAVKNSDKIVGWIGLVPMKLATNQLAQSFVDQQRQSYLFVAVIVLVLSLILAAIWGQLFLRPIHRVAQAARQLANGDYDTRVAVTGKDELAQLSLNFNQMAEILQKNEIARRQWIADISHELRTPIAVISGEIEALIDGIRQPTHERIGSLYADIGALAKLVEDLHQLSLSDHGALELVHENIDLHHIIKELAVLFGPRMKERGIQLNIHTEQIQDLRMQGDKHRLLQLLSNLLENSLRYTDKEGFTHVYFAASHSSSTHRASPASLTTSPLSPTTIDIQEAQLQIEIEDSAPTVPDDSLDRIFERLYRVDKSRSRAVGGSGLGLSICKNIVEAQGGTISAEKSSLGGLKVSIRLPISVQPGDRNGNHQ